MAGGRYKNGLDCTIKVVREEGVRGLYRGLSASYLGVGESTLHWVLYEQMKMRLKKHQGGLVQDYKQKSPWNQVVDLGGRIGAAGGSKLIAVLLAYPHEVSFPAFC